MSNEFNEIKSKNFKFGAPGDYLVGTFLDVTKTTSPDSYGKLSHIYRVKAAEGRFYGSTKNEKTKKWVMDTEQTVVNAGEDYTFFVSEDKGVLIGKMKDIKKGQRFKIVFEETKPTTKGNDAKIIKIFAGNMDPDYVDPSKTGIDEFDSKKTEE